MKGNDIPLSARILQLALKIEAVNTARRRNEAEVMVQEQRGRIFDPQIADAFLEVAEHTNVWETLEKRDLWEEVLGMEPDSPYRNMDESKLDVVALAAADSRIAVLPGQKHIAMYTDPDLFLQEILRFLIEPE